MNIKVFDLHCDTALAMLDRQARPFRKLRSNDGHIDLERGSRLDAYAQCFAMFTFPGFDEHYGHPVTEVFDIALNNLLKELKENSDLAAQARTTAEVNANAAAGKVSAILTLEGPAGIGFDPARLEELAKIGFRISTLSWNESNPLTGSCVTGGGLTDLGREYVRECQRLGILVDVSHISDEAFWDIMKITEAPVIASHSNSRSVYNVPRNLTDDMFRAICETGGTAGFNMYTGFIGEGRVDLDTICDHMLHFLELNPEGTCISLGGDLDGCDETPDGFAGIQDYPRVAERMIQRGIDEKTVHNICWNNAMGVKDRAVRNHQK